MTTLEAQVDLDRWALPLQVGDPEARPATAADVPRTEDLLTVYPRSDGKWAWHLQAAGNRAILATDGGQGYNRRGRAIELAERVCRRAAVVLES